MTRSKSKLLYVHRSQFPRFFFNNKKKILRKPLYKYVNEKGIRVGAFYFFWKRYSVINRKLIFRRFALYNGFLFHVLTTNEQHLGYRLGEFTATWKTAIHAWKQRQKKKHEKIKRNFENSNKYSAYFLKKSKTKVSNRQKKREEKKNK